MTIDDKSPGQAMAYAAWLIGAVMGIGIAVSLTVAFGNPAIGIGTGIACGTIVVIAFSMMAAKMRSDEAAASSGLDDADPPQD